jgi:hypothetical protein
MMDQPMFEPHPNLSDEINHNIVQSEIEGGVSLDQLPTGALLEMETCNRFYELEYRGNGQALIAGHPQFCPEPVLVNVHGSTWGRAMLKVHYIGRGMFLEFDHPEFGVIRTSQIQEIRELRPPVRRTEPVYGYAG